jgi:hypothetical protein
VRPLVADGPAGRVDVGLAVAELQGLAQRVRPGAAALAEGPRDPVGGARRLAGHRLAGGAQRRSPGPSGSQNIRGKRETRPHRNVKNFFWFAPSNPRKKSPPPQAGGYDASCAPRRAV